MTALFGTDRLSSQHRDTSRPCGPARDYLEREWGIRYKNGKSLWWLFKKHRVKWKTGRRRHQKANAEQQVAFKKTSGAWSSNQR
jgi:transposase